MQKLIEEYGKVILYIFIASVIVFPILFWVMHNGLGKMSGDVSEDVFRDNSFVAEYPLPEITTDFSRVKILKDTNPDLISLFNVSATVNDGATPVDDVEIITSLNTGVEGDYVVRFRATYTYTGPEGEPIPRTSTYSGHIVVE